MNIFNLRVDTRIKLLKICLAGTAGTLAATIAIATLEIRGLEKQANRWHKLAMLNFKIIQRFADLSDDEMLIRIKDEFGFEAVTIDLDDPEK